MKQLIFYADKIMVMGKSKNLCVFNFTILLKIRKSRKFDAREIYTFYNIHRECDVVWNVDVIWNVAQI